MEEEEGSSEDGDAKDRPQNTGGLWHGAEQMQQEQVVEFQAYKAAALWKTDGFKGNPVLGEIPPDLLCVLEIFPEK